MNLTVQPTAFNIRYFFLLTLFLSPYLLLISQRSFLLSLWGFSLSVFVFGFPSLFIISLSSLCIFVESMSFCLSFAIQFFLDHSISSFSIPKSLPLFLSFFADFPSIPVSAFLSLSSFTYFSWVSLFVSISLFLLSISLCQCISLSMINLPSLSFSLPLSLLTLY